MAGFATNKSRAIPEGRNLGSAVKGDAALIVSDHLIMQRGAAIGAISRKVPGWRIRVLWTVQGRAHRERGQEDEFRRRWGEAVRTSGAKHEAIII